MRRSPKHFSAFLIAALTPVALQSSDCSTSSGNPALDSLAIEAAGVDRVIGFRPGVLSYTIGTPAGVDTVTVRAQTAVPAAQLSYRLTTVPEEYGTIGFGGGEIDLPIPVDTPVTLYLEVVERGKLRTYTIDLNASCQTSPCDDGNSCSTDSCDAVTEICQFSGVADAEPCTGNMVVDGVCNGQRCESTARLIDFESMTVDDQNSRFGLDIDRYFEGFDWAYDDPNRIAGPTCTVATLDPPTCWGSWAVDDAGATGVYGASGSENWLRARASGVGKGAKITKLDGFVFRSMMLFTRDRTSYPAFVEEITVTTRDINDVDVSTVVSLQAETWIEVTAGALGLADTDILKAIWFNAAGITSPNAGKFGLDDFKVALD